MYKNYANKSCIVTATTLTVCASCSDSPESGLGASHTSLPDSDDAPHSEYYDIELLPPLGTCRALYPFEGNPLLIHYKIIRSSNTICNKAIKLLSD